MRNISHPTLLLVFLRTYMVGAAFNMRGLQNVGFIHAIEPGLKAIHHDPAALRKARNRYVRHYNCHPYWTPLVAGMFLRTESDIAEGRMTAEAFNSIRDTAANTLSALGDSVVGGTILVTWALATAFLIIGNQVGAAVVFTLAALGTLQIFKLCVFVAGLRYGLTALFWLRRWDLINWGDRIKLCNALLLLFILAQCIPKDTHPGWWMPAVACSIFAAWLTARLHVPRTLLALLATMTLVLAT
ncbi:PTS system mannose/fructose/sorbose family transporter subunit IID [Desulfovibrio sp. OttesenSCG-928-O18]|nr:PTS system mannose/fructose/sorbose family transporter subunit IID [Desulfovibrio sp. OttesenSCG-928-O18]